MNTFDRLESQLQAALSDLRILCGDEVGAPAVSWQDVAGTASLNLQSLAAMLDSLRQGETHFRGVPWTGPTVFPSPDEGAKVQQKATALECNDGAESRFRFWTFLCHDPADEVELDEWTAVVDETAGGVIAYCESANVAERVVKMLGETP